MVLGKNPTNGEQYKTKCSVWSGADAVVVLETDNDGYSSMSYLDPTLYSEMKAAIKRSITTSGKKSKADKQREVARDLDKVQ